MQNEHTKLKIVRLVDSGLCSACRFASVAVVEMADGGTRKMLHCRRLDCDNWEVVETGDEPTRLQEAE